MRFMIWLFIATILPVALAKCGTCSLSGDQHFITLDGAQHHYNGRGWHRLFQLDRFEVQCLFADCKTGVETIDGHRRRNDARRICLQACRARFSPPGSICPQIVNWEPLQVNGEGHSLVEVNGVRLQMTKGVSQADKDQTWWLRIERVGKDAVAMDVMVGEGAGGLALRLGPKRIVTVTVRGLQGGRGLCGSCDNSTTNDLAGVNHLNVSDIEGHNRFADAHRRGSSGFALIPTKPECAGGSAIREQEEVDKLLKAAEEAQSEEENTHKANLKLAEIGATTFRNEGPDYDANLIVPPVATFANETQLVEVIRDCRAGMVLSADDDHMKFAIDNCILDKARGRGFELAAASNIIAYVQSLMIDEQSGLALHRLPLQKTFCAMCQSAIQTFVVDTKPILKHVVEKQAHYFDPGVAVYTALVPALFDMIEPDPTPRPTKPPLPMPVLGMPLQLPTMFPSTNESVPNLSSTGPSKSLPGTTQNSSLASPQSLNSSSSDAAVEPVLTGPKEESVHSVNSGQSSNHSFEDSGSKHPKSKDAELSKSKEDSKKKSKSDDDSDSGKYHLKGGKPVSNEDEDYDGDDEESTQEHHRRSGSKGSHKKEKHSSQRNDKEDDDESEDNEDDDNHKKKAKSTSAPTPEPKPTHTPAPLTPVPTPPMTRAPILPGSTPIRETAAPDLISNMAPISPPDTFPKPEVSNLTYPTVKATIVRI